MKGKRATSLFLALALVLGMVVVASPPPAYAAETKDGFGFNTDPPSDFNAGDGKNPYGKGRVALNPIREIAVMGATLPPAVYDANDTVDYAARDPHCEGGGGQRQRHHPVGLRRRSANCGRHQRLPS